MTERIHEFLRRRTDEGPCLVVDLEVVRDNYRAFANALPDTRVFYAVKANPAPEVLTLLAGLGSCFDAASIAEIEMVIMCEDNLDFIGAQKFWYVLLRRWFSWMIMRGAPIDRRVVVCKQLQTQIQPKA